MFSNYFAVSKFCIFNNFCVRSLCSWGIKTLLHILSLILSLQSWMEESNATAYEQAFSFISPMSTFGYGPPLSRNVTAICARTLLSDNYLINTHFSVYSSYCWIIDYLILNKAFYLSTKTSKRKNSVLLYLVISNYILRRDHKTVMAIFTDITVSELFCVVFYILAFPAYLGTIYFLEVFVILEHFCNLIFFL